MGAKYKISLHLLDLDKCYKQVTSALWTLQHKGGRYGLKLKINLKSSHLDISYESTEKKILKRIVNTVVTSDTLMRCLLSFLTPNKPLNQLWCFRSKLNMDEICSLNIHL